MIKKLLTVLLLAVTLPVSAGTIINSYFRNLAAAAYCSDPLGGQFAVFINDPNTMFQNSDGTGAVASDADRVCYWEDQSGNGNHLIQTVTADCPSYQTSEQNGESALFVEAGDFLESDITWSGTSALEVLFVRRVESTGGGNIFSFCSDATTCPGDNAHALKFAEFGTSYGSDYFGDGGTALVFDPLSVTSTQASLYQVKIGATTGELFVDTTSIGTDPNPDYLPAFSPDTIQLGESTTSQGSYYFGLTVLDTDLSSGDQTTYETCVDTKFNMANY